MTCPIPRMKNRVNNFIRTGNELLKPATFLRVALILLSPSSHGQRQAEDQDCRAEPSHTI